MSKKKTEYTKFHNFLFSFHRAPYCYTKNELFFPKKTHFVLLHFSKFKTYLRSNKKHEIHYFLFSFQRHQNRKKQQKKNQNFIFGLFKVQVHNVYTHVHNGYIHVHSVNPYVYTCSQCVHTCSQCVYACSQCVYIHVHSVYIHVHSV